MARTKGAGAMLELYQFPESTCSQKVRICLGEKGLEWVERRLDWRKRKHLTPEYLALNPNWVVPTLVHDGRSVIDSNVIMQYLDEVFPEPPLSPADPLARARMRAWLSYFNDVSVTAIRLPS